uniref:Uncharacterized protein n=1 Tax=Echinococcus canadensis TaxID=519352 RepID=A0A915EV64_9CEST
MKEEEEEEEEEEEKKSVGFEQSAEIYPFTHPLGQHVSGAEAATSCGSGASTSSLSDSPRILIAFINLHVSATVLKSSPTKTTDDDIITTSLLRFEHVFACSPLLFPECQFNCLHSSILFSLASPTSSRNNAIRVMCLLRDRVSQGSRPQVTCVETGHAARDSVSHVESSRVVFAKKDDENKNKVDTFCLMPFLPSDLHVGMFYDCHSPAFSHQFFTFQKEKKKKESFLATLQMY